MSDYSSDFRIYHVCRVNNITWVNAVIMKSQEKTSMPGLLSFGNGTLIFTHYKECYVKMVSSGGFTIENHTIFMISKKFINYDIMSKI